MSSNLTMVKVTDGKRSDQEREGDKITAEADVFILKDLYIQCYVLIEPFNDDLSCDTLGTVEW